MNWPDTIDMINEFSQDMDNFAVHNTPMSICLADDLHDFFVDMEGILHHFGCRILILSISWSTFCVVQEVHIIGFWICPPFRI